MNRNELHRRLLEDAQSYDPAAHTRSLLAPYRDVLLLQRAKYMSYEQIAATLFRHGLKVSPAAVGCFCRRHFSKAEIEAARRAPPSPTMAAPTPHHQPRERSISPTEPGKRGPKIARNDY